MILKIQKVKSREELKIARRDVHSSFRPAGSEAKNWVRNSMNEIIFDEEIAGRFWGINAQKHGEEILNHRNILILTERR